MFRNHETWIAPGFLDNPKPFLIDTVVVYRREPFVASMSPLPVVEHFDVVSDVCSGFASRSIDSSIDTSLRRQWAETFGYGIVETV